MNKNLVKLVLSTFISTAFCSLAFSEPVCFERTQIEDLLNLSAHTNSLVNQIQNFGAAIKSVTSQQDFILNSSQQSPPQNPNFYTRSEIIQVDDSSYREGCTNTVLFENTKLSKAIERILNELMTTCRIEKNLGVDPEDLCKRVSIGAQALRQRNICSVTVKVAYTGTTK